MARCALCESETSEASSACGACGHSVDGTLTSHSSSATVQKAIEAARKDLASKAAGDLDLTFPQALLERAEQTEAAGEHGRALDLARAARRASLLARRRARIAAALARAEAVLGKAREAGVETVAFERNLRTAQERAAKGDFLGAETLLRRLSVRALDRRRDKRLRAVLVKADKEVRGARARGGDIGDATDLLAKAREALGRREYAKVPPLAAKAIELANAARRSSRTDNMIARAALDVEAARETGVPAAFARKALAEAREASRRGLFADVTAILRQLRQDLRDSRHHAQSEAILRAAERAAAREARRGIDVSRAQAVLTEGRKALEARDHPRVRALAGEATDAIRDAALLGSLREALGSLQLDGEDLRAIGVDTTEFDAQVSALSEAIGSGNLPEARRLVRQARFAAETARDGHRRAHMQRAFAIIVANASRGLDPQTAVELLQEVDDAISIGRSVDIQQLIETRMADQDARRRAALEARLIRDRDLVIDLQRNGQDTVAMEGKLADGAIALREARFTQADALLDAVEHDLHAARENLRCQAAEILGRARGEVARAEAESLSIGTATIELQHAQAAYSDGRYMDAIAASRQSLAAVEEAARQRQEERRKAEGEKAARRSEHSRRLQGRVAAVRTEIEDLLEDNVDLAQALRALGSAEDAIQRNDFDEAELQITAAEGIVRGARAALHQQAQEAVGRGRVRFGLAQTEGVVTPAIEALMLRASEAVEMGRPVRAIATVAELEVAIDVGRKERLMERQRIMMEQARAAASKVITVKGLTDDLRKAEIDITGAQEVLRAAEEALKDKDYERVEEVLASLDATAKELMEELVAAARELLNRVERRLHDARAEGLDVEVAGDLLNRAHAHFAQADYDDAIESAKAAEKAIVEILRKHETAQEEQGRRARDAAKDEIGQLKKILADLGRADIAITNADLALSRAEAAFEEGRFDDVARELADTKEIAESLTIGLEAAAKDLIKEAEREVVTTRSSGLAPARAEMVLVTAKEAIEDRRFVEAIEYKKVIEDIIEDIHREKAVGEFRQVLSELQARIETQTALGADLHIASDLLAKAQERLAQGDVTDLDELTREIGQAIDTGRHSSAEAFLGVINRALDEGLSLGLSSRDVEALRADAEAAVNTGDLEEVQELKRRVEERVEKERRRSLTRKATAEIQSLNELIVQSEELGITMATARARLGDARRSAEIGDFEALQRTLAEARTAIEEARASQIAHKYDARFRAVSIMLADAKRLGADVVEAERAMREGEAALRSNEFAQADLLLKQAEVAIGIQIQNFIKNRYPNLVLQLPSSGLQADVWNRYSFEIENRGKLPARDVEIRFEGVETKGMTPIAELGVDERRTIEIGLKPSSPGKVRTSITISYLRSFDENRYEFQESQDLRVEPPGTYLVEDVFLIHSDGRLIAHQSRKFREEIDEDIFSGMLTVVQDFVKDSFRQRSRVGLKRLDFGDSKILIERSPHVFLAAVLLGEEPKLLPLYMVEVLKEVEDRFGNTLNRWSGMLHEIEGVEGVIAKLVMVATTAKADMGRLAESPVTHALQAIEALGGDQTQAVDALLKEATSSLETDIHLSWHYIERAKDQAELARQRLEEHAEEMLAGARSLLEEMTDIGADTSQAELLLKAAEEAFQEKKFERVQEIERGLRDSLERVRSEQSAKKVELELTSLINEIQVARSQSMDVREAEAFLTKIEDAIQRRNFRQVEEYLRRAKDSLARQRRRAVMDKAQGDLARLRATAAEARAVRLDFGDVVALLDKAEGALAAGNLKELEPILERAQALAKTRIEEVLRDQHPRLFLETAHLGLEANRWNRYRLDIANKGNWPAKDVTPTVLGPVDVRDLQPVERIEPNARVSVEFGIRPHVGGTMDLDFGVQYMRPLDNSAHELTETSTIRVEPEGGYAVEDVFLLSTGGQVLLHESRYHVPPDDRGRAATLAGEARAFVPPTFERGSACLRRGKMGALPFVAARGPHALLVATLRDSEPESLLLYLIQSLREIEEAYGDRLKAPDEDGPAPTGAKELVQKLLFATGMPGVSLGPLEDTPVSKIPTLVDKGLLQGPEGEDFLPWARGTLETATYEEALQVLDRIVAAGGGPTEEVTAQIHEAVMASKEAGALQLTDEQVVAYVDILRRTLEAVIQAKMRAGIARHWPVSRLAIKASDQLGYDAVSAFRKIIVSQSGAKELDIVSPTETWRGMKIQTRVNMEAVSAAYRLWAKKIEILLKSQDAWKIKAGLDRGEYAVGIEGQTVRIDPTMVSFLESVPEHIVEEPFMGGLVYLDTRMTKDLLAEGYAKEVVNLVREARKDLRIPEDRPVELDIVADGEVGRMLVPWTDLILREANAVDVRFPSQPPQGAYVVEAVLGEASFHLAVTPA